MSGEAMKIRSATTADASAIQAIYAPIVRDTIISFETEVPTIQEIARRIDNTLNTHPYLVAEIDGGVAGYAYASQHRARSAYRWSVDVSVYVAKEARRSGLARALYGRLLPMLAEQQFHAAFAGIALPNPGSVGFHEAMGFTPVGVYREVGYKFGRWCDVGWWQRLLKDR
jgi:L-amino acid N-acyltransferase YncA